MTLISTFGRHKLMTQAGFLAPHPPTRRTISVPSSPPLHCPRRSTSTRRLTPSASSGFGKPGQPSPRTPTKCPCGSKRPFTSCCGPHMTTTPTPSPSPTAESLMRTRFTAYVLGDFDHIMATTHPANEDYRGADARARAEWRAGLDAYFRRWEYVRLKVVRVDGGGEADGEGTVEFKAYFRKRAGQARAPAVGEHWERSYFEKSDGRWLYRRGEVRG